MLKRQIGIYEVLCVIRDAGDEGITINAIAEQLKLNTYAVRAYIHGLRRRNNIKVIGRVGDNRAGRVNVYAYVNSSMPTRLQSLMPGERFKTLAEHIATQGSDDDFEPMIEPTPTVATPGTTEKIEIFRQRVERGEWLWHPNDVIYGWHRGNRIPVNSEWRLAAG